MFVVGIGVHGQYTCIIVHAGFKNHVIWQYPVYTVGFSSVHIVIVNGAMDRWRNYDRFVVAGSLQQDVNQNEKLKNDWPQGDRSKIKKNQKFNKNFEKFSSYSFHVPA